ncbi:MAG: TonB-dependent receptor domain-containing protein [Phormidesmis sp.]
MARNLLVRISTICGWGVSVPIVVMAQAARASITQVTDVTITRTPEGFNLILETADGSQSQAFTRVSGSLWTADVTQAQLLGDRIRIENPIAGLEFVDISSLDSNSIRVMVSVQPDVMIEEVVASADEPLSFNFVASGIARASIEESDSTTASHPSASSDSSAQLPETDHTETDRPETESSSETSSDLPPNEDNTIRLIVTAEKVEEDAQEVPISLTALTVENLEDGQIDSLQDIARYTPNFYFNPVTSGGNYFSYYSIRGLGNANFLNRDAVGFYVDDVPYDYGGFLDFDLIDLEQVEILRGPQNTLYGRSSAAGAVNIVSRRPTDELEIRGAASYGNENSTDLQLSASGAIIPDELAFRLSGSYTARDGFFDNTFLDRSVGETAAYNGRSRLVWTPSEEWDVSFTASASGDNDGAPVLVPFDTDTPFTIEQDFDGFYDASSNTQALRVGYENEQISATSITARRYSYQNSQLDADASAADLFRRLATFDSTVWSQELRLQSSAAADRFGWLFGTYYESSQFDAERVGLQFSQQAAALFGLPSGGIDRSDYESDRETYAIFGQLNYRPVDPLTITAGLRYESSTNRLDRQRNFEVEGSSVLVPSGSSVEGAKRSDGELLPRLAVDYELSDNVFVYASAARGYRPGGLNPTAEQDSVLEYEEETAWNYEIGLKSTWLDDRLSANLALFTNQINDYQVLQRSFDGVSADITNADAQINGIELELRAIPVEGLELTAGFGYTDARFNNYINPFTGDDLDGNRLPYAPNYNYSLAAQYRSVGGNFSRLELQGSGASFFDDANQFEQDAYVLVNGRLGYEWDETGVYVFANNLFDTQYLTTAFSAVGQDFGAFGEPRTFGVQVRSTF